MYFKVYATGGLDGDPGTAPSRDLTFQVYPQNCVPTGTPTPRCVPEWLYVLDGTAASSPAVSNGRVFVSSFVGRRGSETLEPGGLLYAFPALCPTPEEGCEPLWVAEPPHATFRREALAVWEGSVYAVATGAEAGDADRLLVYPEDCRSDGGVCEPTEEAALDGILPCKEGAASGCAPGIALSDDRMFLSVEKPDGTYQFGAYWVDCARRPGGCRPLWVATTLTPMNPPAVAEGRVYTSSGAVFDLDCRRDGDECTPLYWMELRDNTSPSVAGDLVYVNAGDDNGLLVYPRVCTSASEPGLPACGTPVFGERRTGFPSGNLTVSDGVLLMDHGSSVKVYRLRE